MFLMWKVGLLKGKKEGDVLAALAEQGSSAGKETVGGGTSPIEVPSILKTSICTNARGMAVSSHHYSLVIFHARIPAR
jgi:hypothetical protein